MNRLEVIQKIIAARRARNYLEIGVEHGATFLSVRARRKVAVDPHFQISRRRRFKTLLRNLNAEYHAMTSDEYFQNADPRKPFDVAFIDGLHTYPQALRDVENTLAVLADGGVIVVHDCNPPTAAAAHPGKSPAEVATLNLPGWDWSWCGDVWKTVCHLRIARRDLNIFVLDCDFGLGIITRGNAEEPLNLSLDELESLTFADLEKNRQHF
ncbi:MAG: class I SAM-dependent methyltransferase, partial [Verrucomicrobia bacterium]|nr:class I SAM-dependent methyltransferase [Verrucomicrobiota bacterium]